MELDKILITCANVTGYNLRLSLRKVLFVFVLGLFTCKPFFLSIHYLDTVFLLTQYINNGPVLSTYYKLMLFCCPSMLMWFLSIVSYIMNSSNFILEL